MNWKQEAKNDLYKLRKQQQALADIPEQLEALRESIESARGSRTDASPVQGGSSGYEERMLNNLVKREKLRLNYRIVHRQVTAVEAALATLDDRQCRVLELLYIDKQAGAIERLMNEHGITDRQVWRVAEQALYGFTIARYGLQDL